MKYIRIYDYMIKINKHLFVQYWSVEVEFNVELYCYVKDVDSK